VAISLPSKTTLDPAMNVIVNEKSLNYFRQLLGEKYVSTEKQDLETFGRDWTKSFPAKPAAILLPSTTAEISAILKHCNDHKIAVVPSGGRTGLAGAAVAPNGEVVVSMNRFNKIEHVDTAGMTIRTQAGVTTQALQEAAREAGLFFPVDLAAKGSCQIGGNIATNAGGVKLIRYGGTREQLLGLEVVLPSGEVLDMNTGLRKNNTGYDLKQLFVGSEGTLGIVTRATLKLMPPPRNVQLSVMAAKSFTDIPKILGVCNLEGVTITAFEFFTRKAHEIVLKHTPGARSPFNELSPFYVLLEVEEGHAGGGVMEGLLEKIFEHELITDAVIATSSAQFKDLWGLRENITESISAHGHVRKNDISLAIDQLDGFIKDLEREIVDAPEDIELVIFGHIGDGNLHINYVGPKTGDFVTFQKKARVVEEGIFRLIASYKGSISAEHGIGLLKKHDLHFSRSPAEIAIMKQMKGIFDPKGIMNPGKIFD
jgi:FAD/FMN-containing dehydrogenase